MENLSLIAAIGRSNELGLQNHLIWKTKEDLSFYRSFTLHQNIIMGRKTFESMPFKAMQERNIFVLSSKNIDAYGDVNTFADISLLLKYIDINRQQNFIVVGGAQVYESFIPYVDTMYLTEIDANADADSFFPHIELDDWDMCSIYYGTADYEDNNKISYVRNRYTRKKVK